MTPVDARGPLVELAGVTRRYGRLVALQGVDLAVVRGEFVFLVGPSEAGKTTLLKLIHGDVRPTAGSVVVDRHRLHRRWGRSLPALRRDAAAVFQDHRLLPDMTALANVTFALQVADLGMPRREVAARARRRLHEVGLGSRPSAYPHQLSGGQQRRLAVARALGHDPVLLLADEPTANLDHASAERVLELLEARWRAGATVIVATHDQELATSSPHRVVELQGGRVVSDRPGQASPTARAPAGRPATPPPDAGPAGAEPRPAAPGVQAPSAPRRWPWLPAVNLCRLAAGGAAASWLRNLGTSAPALGSIAVLLVVAGTLTLCGFTARTLLGSLESEASILNVYLSDDASSDQVDQARQELAELPHVRSVRYVDKEQALARARERPGLVELASKSSSNPFPAGFEVRVDRPADVVQVARLAAAEPGADPERPTSYDADTYQRLRQLTTWVAAVAGAFGLVMLMVTYVISANSIRAALLARRDELATMQLVGASAWLIRARLAVEGALTGGLAGALAGASVVGLGAAAVYGSRRLLLQVLPGVTVATAAGVAVAVLVTGTWLGSLAALLSFRRLRA